MVVVVVAAAWLDVTDAMAGWRLLSGVPLENKMLAIGAASRATPRPGLVPKFRAPVAVQVLGTDWALGWALGWTLNPQGRACTTDPLGSCHLNIELDYRREGLQMSSQQQQCQCLRACHSLLPTIPS